MKKGVSYFCENFYVAVYIGSTTHTCKPSDVLADCQESDILGQLVWIIPVSIVGGILVLGVLLLVIAKIILVSKDSSREDFR